MLNPTCVQVQIGGFYNSESLFSKSCDWRQNFHYESHDDDYGTREVIGDIHHSSTITNPSTQEISTQGKGKAVPLQVWSGPEGYRKLRFPDFMTMAQDGGTFVSLTHRPPLPQEMFLVLISVRGWVDHRVIVRSEGFYVDEKFQWHQLGSNQPPSDL